MCLPDEPIRSATAGPGVKGAGRGEARGVLPAEVPGQGKKVERGICVPLINIRHVERCRYAVGTQ